MSTQEGQDKITDMLLESILNNISENKKLPWERPWNVVPAMNYESMREYTGINRWVLGYGEYLTFNKAKEKGFLPIKGSKQKQVVYLGKQKRKVDSAFLKALKQHYHLESLTDGQFTNKLKDDGLITEYQENFYIESKFLKYFGVFEIGSLQDKEGLKLESRVARGDIELTKVEPKLVAENYLKAENIELRNIDNGSAYYSISEDYLNLPDISRFKSEECYYSVLFHEMAHSTGHSTRLNRIFGTGKSDEKYSMEELVAEFTASILCEKTKVYYKREDFVNEESYLQGWVSLLKEHRKELVRAAAQAEKAADFILSMTITLDKTSGDT